VWSEMDVDSGSVPDNPEPQTVLEKDPSFSKTPVLITAPAPAPSLPMHVECSPLHHSVFPNISTQPSPYHQQPMSATNSSTFGSTGTFANHVPDIQLTLAPSTLHAHHPLLHKISVQSSLVYEDNSSPMVATIPTSTQSSGSTTLAVNQASNKKRRKKRKFQGGHCTALYRRFQKPFWEWIESMTSEELTLCMATCTPAQQEYITRQLTMRHTSGEVEDGEINCGEVGDDEL
jgi:hypothetical protein